MLINFWFTFFAAAQEKQMEVCDVCGAFLIVNDVQQRVDDHLMGKQHVGFGKLKAALDELLEKRRTDRADNGRRWGRGSVSDQRSAEQRSTSRDKERNGGGRRDRDRERDRDRGSRDTRRRDREPRGDRDSGDKSRRDRERDGKRSRSRSRSKERRSRDSKRERERSDRDRSDSRRDRDKRD